MKPDQERVKNLLTDTVTLLCRNGLQFQKEIKVQGLLGITLDESEVFLVHIDEKIGGLISFPVSVEGGLLPDSLLSSQQQSPSLASMPFMEKSKNFGANINRQPMKPSLRPMRPSSRFGHRQPFPSIQKRRHRISPPSASLSKPNGSHQSGDEQAISADNLTLEGQQSEQQSGDIADKQLGTEQGDELPIRIKKEENDDDVIFVDQDRDIKMQNDDRSAMLGSYATEVTGNEAHLAQDIFSEFSLLTNNSSHGGELGSISEMAGGPFVGGIVRNYASQSLSGNDQLNSSAPGGSLQWDVASGSNSLSQQSSQSFTSTPNRTMPSVGQT